jgi:hypothetical protein
MKPRLRPWAPSLQAELQDIKVRAAKAQQAQFARRSNGRPRKEGRPK